jgi:hypothetical protein
VSSTRNLGWQRAWLLTECARCSCCSRSCCVLRIQAHGVVGMPRMLVREARRQQLLLRDRPHPLVHAVVVIQAGRVGCQKGRVTPCAHTLDNRGRLGPPSDDCRAAGSSVSPVGPHDMRSHDIVGVPWQVGMRLSGEKQAPPAGCSTRDIVTRHTRVTGCPVEAGIAAY